MASWEGGGWAIARCVGKGFMAPPPHVLHFVDRRVVGTATYEHAAPRHLQESRDWEGVVGWNGRCLEHERRALEMLKLRAHEAGGEASSAKGMLADGVG